LAELDAAATRRLCAAIVALNHADATADPFAGLPAALVAATLRLCGALGWTLERVLSTPAPEVERLLALLDRVEVAQGSAQRRVRARSQAPSRPRIADHPDAVVFLFEDDGGES
jgi:hypothetical protein